jgi:hypothetical protein
MILYMTEVVNHGMGMDYTPNHEKLIMFVCKITK